MNDVAPGVVTPLERVQALRAGLRRSLYVTVLLLFLGILLLLLGLFYLTTRQSRAQVTAQLQGQLASVAILHSAQIDQWIQDRAVTLKLVARQPGALDDALTVVVSAPGSPAYTTAKDGLTRRLMEAQRADPEYAAFVLVDTTLGDVTFATDAQYDGKFFGQKEAFLQGVHGEYIQLPSTDISDPAILGGEPFMAVSRPITDTGTPLHPVRGVLIGLIDARRVAAIIGEVPGIEQGQAHIISSGGWLMVSSDPKITRQSLAADPTVSRVLTATHPVVAGESYVNFIGQRVFGYGVWYRYSQDSPELAAKPDRGFALFVEQPEDVALAGLNQLTTMILGAAALAGILIAVGGALIARSVVQPITALTESAVRIAGGDLDTRVTVRRSDEIGVLASAFNTMTGELKGLYEGLEQKVAERTRDLEQANAQIIRRALQLQTSAEVAQATTSVLDVGELLDRAVSLIRERFGFYHVQVFLLDTAGEYAVLRASTGEVGRELLQRGHRLAVASKSLIGFVTANRVTHVAMDVAGDEFHRFNPLLPETRAEMAVPLVIGDRLLGALDVQSVDVNAFGYDDIALFESLAAQLAVAIENARLFQATQEAARRERMVKELTDRIRGSMDMQQIMETTARELSRALGVQRAVVRVGAAAPAAGETPALPTPAAELDGNGREPAPAAEPDGAAAPDGNGREPTPAEPA